ncbi:Exostosin, GT47 domain [Dillenia turbinata]|uniref:Exostosin, GT47 domain n=1 Tax=Dillenia turbinata TaxID=194707 RepID=A0AAN8VA09_9MAGN
MLPSCNSPERKPQPLLKPNSPESTVSRKSSPHSLSHPLSQAHHSLHPRSWLIITIFSLQLLLFLTARYLPFASFRRRNHFPSPYQPVVAISAPAIIDECSSGKVYVYNLPPIFNTDFIEKCNELDPWNNSGCNAVSNNGIGRPANGLIGLVPQNLTGAWFRTDQFAAEIIFHNRILQHKCRTLDPNSASGFYIPFYAGLAVGKYLWSNCSAKDRDYHGQKLLEWVQDQPFWNRSYGRDHFITLGRITWDFRRSKDEGWGSSFLYMKGMRNITRLVIEKNPWDYFDIGVPYPTGFHPRNDADVIQWQNHVRRRPRKNLFCFAGAPRGKFKNDFRGILLDQCKRESDACKAVDCGGRRCVNGTSEILKTFLDSEFCLQPRGDSFTRRSIFDCMIAGSIPVFFWKRTAYYQYKWFLPTEPSSYSVYIHRSDVKNGIPIRALLEKYSKEEVRRMREKVIEYIPKLVYAKPSEGLETIKDAFDVAMDELMKRFKGQEEDGFKWK